MKSITSQILYAYWNEVRSGRLAPRRFEIEPARIASILADTMLLELSGPQTYRFRLAGTRICEHFTTELRGASFLDLWDEPARQRLQQAMEQVETMGCVATFAFDAVSLDERRAPHEGIILPLLHSKQTVDRFLGAISCMLPPPWLGHEPIARLDLDDCETIWPDGKPHAVIESLGNNAPFRPIVAESSIVRFNRRQFRVLEGGLSGRNRNEN